MRRIKILLVAIASCVAPLFGAEPGPSERAQLQIDKGLAYLRAQQKPDHSWQRDVDQPAVTAIVLKAFLGDKQYDAGNPIIKDGFERLLTYQQPNGGIYKDMLANYNTAIAVSALAEVRGTYAPQMEKAVVFLKQLQWNNNPENLVERKTVEASDVRFGGWGYGRKERPDLSNLQVALDALTDSALI